MSQEQALFSREDHRDILEAAGAAAFGFATLHEYMDWRRRHGHEVGWLEKFGVMFVTTALVFMLLRMLTKKLWPLPGK